MIKFTYPGWTLAAAIDALMAYDHGATDSGVNDPKLKAAVKAYLTDMDADDLRLVLAKLARSFLEDNEVKEGYGLADVVEFARWVETEMGVDL